MSGQALSELALIETPTDDDRLYVVQGGVSGAVSRSKLFSGYRRMTDGQLVTVDLGDVTDATLQLDGTVQHYRARLVGDGILTLVEPSSGYADVRLDLRSDTGLRVFAWSSVSGIAWLSGSASDNTPPTGNAVRRYYLSAGPGELSGSWADYWEVA
jgi:hypothetical protein